MKRLFNKDWCTFWPDYIFSISKGRRVYLGNICFLHDRRYADKSKSRWTADLELFNDVKNRGLPVTASIMWIGVRLFGWYWYHKSIA